MSAPRTRLAAVGAMTAMLALPLGACATSGGSPTNAPVVVSSLAATAVPEATATLPSGALPSPTELAGGGSAPPTATDPCSLLTADEASTAVGQTLGAGVSSLVDQDRVCTWKAGTTEVKLFLAPLAPDVATATTYWDAERSQVPADFPPVQDITLYDRAAYVSGGQAGFSISALFVIKGLQAFDFYCGLVACTEVASVTAATLIGGRLP